jgi:hypothetical protein
MCYNSLRILYIRYKREAPLPTAYLIVLRGASNFVTLQMIIGLTVDVFSANRRQRLAVLLCSSYCCYQLQMHQEMAEVNGRVLTLQSVLQS